jgi:small GTP-binding protein
MIEKTHMQKDSRLVTEYYKAICTLPYKKHPIFLEIDRIKIHYITLLNHLSLIDGKLLEHKQAVHLFYRKLFDADIENIFNQNDQKSLQEVARLRYEFKKYYIHVYTYRYLFFAHYLFLRYGLIEEEDPYVQKILIRKELKISKKDALNIIHFTNAVKSYDFESAKPMIKEKKFGMLAFFYESFMDYDSYRRSGEKTFLVVGTMSAGKSTFLNSILGKDLFPSQNEACTSKIYKYINRPSIDHFITSKNGEEYFRCLFDLTEKDLLDWNNDSSRDWVQLEGSLANLNSIDSRLTFIDTPGTNNSMDRTHSDKTMKALKSNKYDSVLYLLNATQLGTDDDKLLLTRTREYLGKHQEKDIIFVVNKVDEIDESSGETVADLAKNTIDYLEQNGFKNPQVLYVSALAAKLSQMVLSQKILTRKERNMFHFYYDFFSDKESDLNQYSNIGTPNPIQATEIGQVKIQDKEYDISIIYNVINHSGMNQILNII